MKQYIVIAQISDEDGYGAMVVSAGVEAKSREDAIAEASKHNNYDPDSDAVDICAVYEITGANINIELVH